MKTIHYRKLVRDNIPAVIEASGKSANWYIAKDDEFYAKLKEKLVEEIEEFLKSDTVEELADIAEVIEAILHSKQVPLSEFTKIRAQKNKEKGAFSKKIILESVVSEA